MSRNRIKVICFLVVIFLIAVLVSIIFCAKNNLIVFADTNYNNKIYSKKYSDHLPIKFAVG